jgi:hypothetical protein
LIQKLALCSVQASKRRSNLIGKAQEYIKLPGRESAEVCRQEAPLQSGQPAMNSAFINKVCAAESDYKEEVHFAVKSDRCTTRTFAFTHTANEGLLNSIKWKSLFGRSQRS